jgi:hypothetical protein
MAYGDSFSDPPRCSRGGVCIKSSEETCTHGCVVAEKPTQQLAEPPLTPEEEEELLEDSRFTAGEDKPHVTWEEAKARARRRRPPYAVAYSVGGHAYELLLPGDATAIAEDGFLKISHDGPVLGIIRVMPVVRMEGADGADTDDG